MLLFQKIYTGIQGHHTQKEIQGISARRMKPRNCWVSYSSLWGVFSPKPFFLFLSFLTIHFQKLPSIPNGLRGWCSSHSPSSTRKKRKNCWTGRTNNKSLDLNNSNHRLTIVYLSGALESVKSSTKNGYSDGVERQ